MFEVDPLWPKPLPNHWLIGMTIGVSVDARTMYGSSIARGRSKKANSTPRRIRHWQCVVLQRLRFWNSMRGQSASPLGRTRKRLRLAGLEPRDYRRLQGNVWIGGNGRGKAAAPPVGGAPDESAASATASYLDNQVLKFTQDGQFLMQIGKPSHSRGSNDVENLRLRQRRSSTRKPMKCTWPTATATTA